ncbi:MAG: ABC transporter permease [Candidatus Eisenbacteria bacterium]
MFLRALTKSIANRPQRFAVAVLAVAMGVGMATALASVSLVLGDRLGRTVRQYGANIILLPRGADMPLVVAGADLSSAVNAGAIPDSALGALRRFRWRNNMLALAPQAYALGVSGTVRVPLVGTWFSHPAPGGGASVDGMTPLAPWWKVTGRTPAEDDAEVLLGHALARRLGLAPGGAIALTIDGRRHELAVVGVLDAGGLEDDQAYVPLAWLQQATGRAGQVDRVLVSALVVPGEAPPMPDPGRDLAGYERWICRPFAASVSHEIESALPGVTARPVAQLVRGEGRLVGRMNLLMLLLTGAALAAAVLGVMSTMVASVVDRTPEIALLRALGASTPAVHRLFLAEALVVALVGGLLGVAIGFGLAQVIGRGTFGTAVEMHPLLVPAGLALATAVGLLGAGLPLRRTAAIDPAHALRAGA